MQKRLYIFLSFLFVVSCYGANTGSAAYKDVFMTGLAGAMDLGEKEGVEKELKAYKQMADTAYVLGDGANTFKLKTTQSNNYKKYFKVDVIGKDAITGAEKQTKELEATLSEMKNYTSAVDKLVVIMKEGNVGGLAMKEVTEKPGAPTIGDAKAILGKAAKVISDASEIKVGKK